MKETLLIGAALVAIIEIGMVLDQGLSGAWRVFCGAVILTFVGSLIGMAGSVVFVAVVGTLLAPVMYGFFCLALAIWRWTAPIRSHKAESAR